LLFWCHAVMSLQFTHVRYLQLQRQVAKLVSSGDSRMKKVEGPLLGKGKRRGANINVYLAW